MTEKRCSEGKLDFGHQKSCWLFFVFFSFLEIMEPLMYKATCKMVTENSVDDLILGAEERIYWQNHISEYSVRKDGGLLWKGLKVPTREQLENVLQPIQYDGKKHVRTTKVLGKALSDLGFVIATIFGGLERDCKLRVMVRYL